MDSPYDLICGRALEFKLCKIVVCLFCTTPHRTQFTLVPCAIAIHSYSSVVASAFFAVFASAARRKSCLGRCLFARAPCLPDVPNSGVAARSPSRFQALNTPPGCSSKVQSEVVVFNQKHQAETLHQIVVFKRKHQSARRHVYRRSSTSIPSWRIPDCIPIMIKLGHSSAVSSVLYTTGQSSSIETEGGSYICYGDASFVP